MKKLLFLILTFCALQAHAQTGILLVHYGTNNDKSRKATLEKIDSLVKAKYPNLVVEEAYTTGTVIRSLEKKGIYRMTVTEAMAKLARKGCKKVVVQSTLLLPGIMSTHIEQDTQLFKDRFEKITIGQPLFYSVEDEQELLKIVANEVPVEKGEQLVLVGHGTADAANAMYSQLEYLAQHHGYSYIHVGTIESFPSFQDIQDRLKECKAKKVVLVPLLYIAGNHQVEDINGEWKENLEKAGYQVRVFTKGLGEYPAIQERILHQIETLIQK